MGAPLEVTQPLLHHLRTSQQFDVPPTSFSLWTYAEQLAYCAARDEDAATHPWVDSWVADFLRARAARYRETRDARTDP